jgi:hypothetical protein
MTAPVWTPTTADERRRVGVAGLVAHVMAVSEGHRYARAYGLLRGLVTSREPSMRNEWAPAFVAALDEAMNEPFNHRQT